MDIGNSGDGHKLGLDKFIGMRRALSIAVRDGLLAGQSPDESQNKSIRPLAHVLNDAAVKDAYNDLAERVRTLLYDGGSALVGKVGSAAVAAAPLAMAEVSKAVGDVAANLTPEQ